jgi:hypothetical protein
VTFLWSLLPGAREARNQVLVGYAWLVALGLWFGVPKAAPSGNLHELETTAGRVSVAIAVSFGAFMIGSLSDDVVSLAFGTRSARAFTTGSAGGLAVLEAMGESGRRELERLEGSIDRSSAELTLRVALLLPLIVGGGGRASARRVSLVVVRPPRGGARTRVSGRSTKRRSSSRPAGEYDDPLRSRAEPELQGVGVDLGRRPRRATALPPRASASASVRSSSRTPLRASAKVIRTVAPLPSAIS